jgi:hypothetical protein
MQFSFIWCSRCSLLAFSIQVRVFKPGRKRRNLKGEKILSTPSFRGEEKPSVPHRRFVGYKRSLNSVEVVISAKIPGQHFRPQFHHSLLESLVWLCTWRHLTAKVGTSKPGERQWQTTIKNLPRVQRTTAIPVA